MKEYKYYTPMSVANMLISLLPEKDYKQVIDISCGSWNLLKAAKERYPNAEFIGVDIDKESVNWKIENSSFVCMDGREYSMQHSERYDLVLSNSPFGSLKKEHRKYSNSNVKNLLEINSSRYENEMLLANLRLSDANGTLLFILPSTFFEGESYIKVRKQLAKSYTIKTIIRLPNNAFDNKDIHTYAFIIINRKNNNHNASFFDLFLINNTLVAKETDIITNDRLLSGEWINRYNKTNKDIIMFRGVISSASFGYTGEKVLHSSSRIEKGEWYPSIKYCNDVLLMKKSKQAEIGDILINRIGRFAGYWTICNEITYVSDCIIVIKGNDKKRIYKKLNSNSINGKLCIKTHGLTTKYITMNDILELL